MTTSITTTIMITRNIHERRIRPRKEADRETDPIQRTEKTQKEIFCVFSLHFSSVHGIIKRLDFRGKRMSRELEKYQMVEQSINKKFHKSLWRPFINAMKQYELVQAGDKIAACVSGGKDSFLNAKLLQMLQRHSDVPFELVFLMMDPGYNE